MDYEKPPGLISYDESGAMTVRREDGTPALNLFESDTPLSDVLRQAAADVAAFNAHNHSPMVRLRRAYHALRGRP